MNIVVDRASDLVNSSLQDEMFTVPNLTAYVLESDWNGLRPVDQLMLMPFKAGGKICFVPLNAITFTNVALLKNRFGGFSIAGLVLVSYCQQFDLPLYTSDPGMIKVAQQVGVMRYETLGEKLKREMINFEYVVTFKQQKIRNG
ncbi:hypothetical protein [Chryseolinea soli]|uniref:Uncharacterized protein n=1 Tax=Chryseolinea soli TaxID=2321403 RepID=A0A385SUN1_9BACT|nr:hypothetical protein [Chryseolinea soli]AYB34919.1 hypothetical protein D4L85_31985 [Chryseolinea soli]